MNFEKEVFDEFMIKGTVNVILSLPPRLTTVSLTTLFEQQLFYQTYMLLFKGSVREK